MSAYVDDGVALRKATVALNDGSMIYTHDGNTSFEVIGVDGYRDYFTAPATPLDTAPAEEAVVQWRILAARSSFSPFAPPELPYILLTPHASTSEGHPGFLR